MRLHSNWCNVFSVISLSHWLTSTPVVHKSVFPEVQVPEAKFCANWCTRTGLLNTPSPKCYVHTQNKCRTATMMKYSFYTEHRCQQTVKSFTGRAIWYTVAWWALSVAWSVAPSSWWWKPKPSYSLEGRFTWWSTSIDSVCNSWAASARVAFLQTFTTWATSCLV